MRLHTILAAGTAMLLSACGGQGDRNAQPAAEANVIENLALPPDGLAPAGAAPTASSGQEYVDLAGSSDLFEIESARLAIEKATRPELRELAQTLLAHHQRSTTQLTAAVRETGEPLDMNPQLSPEQQARIQALRAASGAAFDALYLDQQMEAHERALTLAAAYASEGQVDALRGHASAMAAPIQDHLSRIRALAQIAAEPPPPGGSDG